LPVGEQAVWFSLFSRQIHASQLPWEILSFSHEQRMLSMRSNKSKQQTHILYTDEPELSIAGKHLYSFSQ
jgi:hypothetical protein